MFYSVLFNIRAIFVFSTVGFGKQGLEEFIAEGSLDFDEWTSLISEIENSCPVSSILRYETTTFGSIFMLNLYKARFVVTAG